MRKWIGPALFVAMALLFFIANRGATRGFFQGDELDNIGWTPQIPLADFAKDLASPVYNARNFRPVGHLYFRVMSRTFGLDFRRYLPPLHVLHLINVWLLWLVLRGLGSSRFAAGAGALFFAFHMAVFDVYWKPMYAFDLFCAAFCLLSMLAWMHRRWVLSFAAFWLAYKSKELAVMLPAVLACYEVWLGKRQWKPLIPFFVVSLSFGLQGILLNPNEDNSYAFQFTPAAIVASAQFYAAALFGVPWAGFGVLALPAVWRKPRLWFGIAATALFFVPLVFLPGRLFSAYWYVPLIGLAIAVASLADGRYGRWAAAVLLAIWLPWNYANLRDYRVQKLAEDADVRAYVTQLRAAAPSFRDVRAFLYNGLPPSLPAWGVSGALRYTFPDTNIQLVRMDAPAASKLLRSPWLATLTWVERNKHLWVAVRTPETLDATYITMNEVTPVWQLTDGWYGPDEGYRWMEPHATARLYRARQAQQFEVVMNLSAAVLQAIGHSDFSARLNGVTLGTARLEEPGIRILRWPLPAGPEGTVEVEFDAEPDYQASQNDPRKLGDAIMSFGFLPSGR